LKLTNKKKDLIEVFVFIIHEYYSLLKKFYLKLKEGQLNGSGTESSAIVFGAVSKGIIKRDQQNNAVVYKSYYSTANPFQQMDPVELEKYKKEIAQKQIKDQGLFIIKWELFFITILTSFLSK